MENLLQDVRYGVRMLRKSPGFTLVAVITLALGIGANTAIFSVVNALLMRALPYTDPNRLVLLWSDEHGVGNNRGQVSFTDIDDQRTQNHVFENVVAFGDWSAVFTGDGLDPERISGMQVSDGYFSLMRAKPLLGRDFLPEEQIDGKDGVVILGYGLWQRRFGGDAQIVGKTITLSARPYTVVGVMGKDFPFLPESLVIGGAQFYRPVAEKHDDKERSSRHLRALARLKPGVSLEQAQADVNLINQHLAQQYPKDYATTGVRLVRLQDDMVGDLRPALVALLGAVGFLLLIACANVANLLLARSTTRQREIAIRSALGATRARLVCQSLTESLLLAIAGGTLGVLLARWGTTLISSIGARVLPQLLGVSIDVRVLLFTLAVTLFTGFLFGSAPALHLSSLSTNDALKHGGRGSSGSLHGRLRKSLAICEIALALVLLSGAGLMLRALGKLQDVDPGFQPGNLLTMQIALPSAKYPYGSEKPVAFYRELLERVRTLPGVEAAGAVSTLPLGGDFDTVGIEAEGHVYAPGEEPYPERYIVTPEYFRALQISLLRGRLFSDQDDRHAGFVAIVSSTAAQRWWPAEDPIGKHFSLPGPKNGARVSCMVVGVVKDVKQAGLDAPHTMQIYLPHAQQENDYLTLVVRTSANPLSYVAGIRRQVLAMDRDQPVSQIATMEQVLADSAASRRFSTALFGMFAALGLALASVGVYGILSYSVAQRTREIGIRIALGAVQKDVLLLILRQALSLVGVGILIGSAVSLGVTRVLSSLLFAISSHDPVTFFLTPLVLAAVALMASYVPARRAVKVDPAVALRHE
jgi:putative ABC transport system permease protein